MVNFNRIKKIYSARYQSSRSTVALTDNWKSIFRLTKEISSILLSTYHKKQILLSHLMKRCKGIIHEILFLYYTILLDSFYLIPSTSYVENFQVSCCFQQTQCLHMLTHFLCFFLDSLLFWQQISVLLLIELAHGQLSGRCWLIDFFNKVGFQVSVLRETVCLIS